MGIYNKGEQLSNLVIINYGEVYSGIFSKCFEVLFRKRMLVLRDLKNLQEDLDLV